MQGVVLQPGGRLDMATYADFERVVLAALDAGTPWIVLDFSEVFYLGTLAVRVVMTAVKRCAARKRVRHLCHASAGCGCARVQRPDAAAGNLPDRATALAALS